MKRPNIDSRATCSPLVLIAILIAALFSLPCLGETVAAPVKGDNPYNAELHSIQVEFEKSSAPKQAVLIARAYGTRELVDFPAEIDAWLARVTSDESVAPLVRAEAERYVAMTSLHRGDIGKAEATLESLGLIREWMVLPVTGTRPSGQPPRPGDDFVDEAGMHRSWTSLKSPGPQLWTNLSSKISGNGSVYVASSVYSESERVVALRFGSDFKTTVWVNGTELFSDVNQGSAAFDQHALGVQLHKGWNAVVMRFLRTGEGPARFVARVTELNGGGIRLKTSVEAQQNSEQSQDGAVPPKPEDLVEVARQEVSGESNSVEKQRTLGLIRALHGRDSAVDDLRSAAKRAQSAELWLDVASACTDSECKFSALNGALTLDAHNERAMVQLAEYYISRMQSEKARGLLARAVSIAPNDFVPKMRLAELYADAGLSGLALKQSQKLQEQYPGPVWLKLRAASLYDSLGLADEAKAQLKAVLADEFDDATARSLMAQVLKQARNGDELEALLKQNLRIDPADDDSTAELSRLDGGLSHKQLTKQPSSGDADNTYLEDPEKLAASARQESPALSANAVALSDVRVERLLADALSSVRVQQVFYIATDQGAHQYATQAVQYAPASQELRVLHARIHKADGHVVEAIDGGDSRVSDASVSMYYDVRSREIQFPGLQKGDVVELDYRITPTTTANPYGDYFGNLFVFQTSIPERLKRYVLVTPESRKLNLVEMRMTSPGSVKESNGERVYEWQAANVGALPNESRGPAVTDIAPYVHVSTFASWNDLGRWYADLVGPQFAVNAELKEVAARLTAGKKTDFEKIDAIYQFVLRNTHYVAFEFGVYSYKPYPVTQTYARHFGDCKDKASLLIALLRETGIDADFALLRTRRMGEVDQRAASIALFNHAIVYLPKFDLWLDGTAEYFSPRELPVEDQGAMALVVAADGMSAVKRVPITHADDNYTRRVVRASVANDGTITFQGATYTRGEDAPGLRREFEVPERQRDSLRNTLAQVFPSVRVEDVRVQDNSDPAQAVNVEFRGRLENAIGQNMVSLATTWMQRSYVQNLAPMASRTEPLLLPAPWTTEEELHFQLPANAQVSLPANTELATKYGVAHIKYEKHGRELVIRTLLEFRAVRVEPGDYSAFREFCRALERSFRNEVKVSLHG